MIRINLLGGDIARAQQEQLRLQSIIREVNEFDAQRAQLQQRVQLIEQLRSGQSIPVQMLDVISKSVPDMLWLTDVVQKPIEIVNSTVQSVTPTGQVAQACGPSIDLIKFTVKASLVQNPKEPAPP